MRIVEIITQMEGGGAQAVAMRMAAELRKRGHLAEAWFLYLKRPTYIGREGVRVLLNHPPRGKASYIRVVIALIRELRVFKPDAVITFGRYANLLGQLGALIVRVPVRVASQHNPSWIEPRLARYFDWLIGSLGVYAANIAVSSFVYESFEKYLRPYVKRLRLIHNGLVFSESLLKPAEARAKFSLPQGVPMVVNIGRLAEQKNHEILLQALPFLSQAHLAIAGDGELKDLLAQKAAALRVQDRFHLLGEISPEDVPDFLRTGDLFAFPSRWEGLSFALLEAMYAGLPVIASDIPAVREVLGDGDPAGLLVPLDDCLAWARAIRRVLGSQSLSTALSLHARQRAGLFDLETMVDGYEECLKESSR